MLDAVFREQGWCVVSAGDVIWGSLYDVREFHPPAGVFEGVLAGPPCQEFSPLAHLVRANGHEPHFGNLIPEFERVVAEAQPQWWLMENVPQAPRPVVEGYTVHSQKLNNRWVAGSPEQNRVRVFSFGSLSGVNPWPHLEVECLEAPERYVAVKGDPRPTRREARGQYGYVRDNQAVLGNAAGVPVRIGGSGKVKRTAGAVTANDGGGGPLRGMARYGLEAACELQGLPRDFLDDAPFTAAGKLKVVANGVSLFTGRAVARAIRAALRVSEPQSWTLRFEALPGQPWKTFRPPGSNDRIDWRARAARTRAWRLRVFAAWQEAGIPHLGRVRLSVTFSRASGGGAADSDGLMSCCKALADGLVGVNLVQGRPESWAPGIIQDDGPMYLEWGPVKEERAVRPYKASQAHSAIVMVIEALE